MELHSSSSVLVDHENCDLSEVLKMVEHGAGRPTGAGKL
jgi:hypothetical protein